MAFFGEFKFKLAVRKREEMEKVGRGRGTWSEAQMAQKHVTKSAYKRLYPFEWITYQSSQSTIPHSPPLKS
jgi:hypothetical protein